MKGIGKIFSAGLSLTLCAALVVPSFAASFTDLQNAIDSKEEITEGAITATTEDGVRNVTLHEDVEYGGEDDAKGITIGTNGTVVLNLNGKTIDGGYNAETGEGGSGQSIITMNQGSTLTVNGADEEGNRGTITGGHSEKNGGAIKELDNCTLVVEDTKLTGNRSDGEGGAISLWVGAKVSATNSDFVNNHCQGNGGAVSLVSNGVADFEGVTFKGNSTNGDGGAVGAYYSELNFNDVVATENTALRGGAIWAGTNEQIKMTGNNLIIDNHSTEEGKAEDDFRIYRVGTNTMGMAEEVVYNGLTYTKVENRLNWSDPLDDDDDSYNYTLIKYVHKCVPGTAVRENVIPADVGVPGSYDVAVYCSECGMELSRETRVIPALTDRVDIDDPEVPLAGLFTRGDAIGYLWEQAGSPEAELSTFPDVPEDHQWAVAIGWAEDMGIALPDLEGNFRPDDLVLRSVEGLEVSPEGELQEFLNRYAAYAGIELAEDELFIELSGAWDDVIMGEEAQEIFDGFFAQLEAALAQAA